MRIFCAPSFFPTAFRCIRRALFTVLCPALAACALFCSAAPVSAQGTGPKLPNPGFRSIGLWDPAVPIRMDIAIWYPSIRIPRDIHLEGWTLHAGQNGMTTAGRFPVILLSHSAAGSRLASHDLAAILARNGFMVIAPTHPGDNMDDSSALYSANLFADRPEHMLLALEAVEKNATLRHIMDRSRIGVLGVGAGAATALQLAGAAPDLSRLGSLCSPAGDSVPENPLCSNWGKLFHQEMAADFAMLVNSSRKPLTPAIPKKREPLTGNASLNALAEALAPAVPPAPAAPSTEDDGQLPPPEVILPAPRQTAPSPVPVETQPILAIGLLTPGLLELFPDAALQGITAPVGILAVADDSVYPGTESMTRLQSLLPQRPASRVIRNAGHFDLQAPCPPMFRESFPALCGSREASSEDFRKKRNEFFVRFFQKTLGPPAPPPLIPLK